jgi:hypothetical protein
MLNKKIIPKENRKDYLRYENIKKIINVSYFSPNFVNK